MRTVVFATGMGQPHALVARKVALILALLLTAGMGQPHAHAVRLIARAEARHAR